MAPARGTDMCGSRVIGSGRVSIAGRLPACIPNIGPTAAATLRWISAIYQRALGDAEDLTLAIAQPRRDNQVARRIKCDQSRVEESVEAGRQRQSVKGIERSSSVELRQGLMCDARIASCVTAPVTEQPFPQSCSTCDRNLPWPTRAFTNASFVVAAILRLMRAFRSSVRVLCAVRCLTTRATGTCAATCAYIVPSFFSRPPNRSKVVASKSAIFRASSVSGSTAV